MIGIDIVAIKRFRKLDLLAQKILHAKEQAVFAQLLTKQRKCEFLAGRWALKEAVTKIIPTKVVFSAYSILLVNNRLVIDDPQHLIKNVASISLSLSHEKKYALAVACC